MIGLVILVVVDRFLKVTTYFGMFSTNFSVVKVVELFGSTMCKLHNMPKSILSKRDLSL